MNRDPANPASEMPVTGTDRSRPWVIAALAVVVASALFAVTFNAHTFLESSDCVLRLPLLAHVKHVPEIFGQHFMAFTGGQYRPLPYALLAVARTFVSADHAVFWHVWLVGFHVLNAMLVYTVARHFTRREGPALLVLAVFLLHPLGAAFGNQVNLFPDVLGGSFYLGSLACYLAWARRRRFHLYALALVLFVGGLLSSHVLLTLPVLILLYGLFYERTPAVRSIARVLPFAAGALLMGWCFLTFHPHLVFYTYPPDLPAGVLRYGTWSFAVGGMDSVVGLARGWPLEVPVREVVRRMYGTWNLAAVTLVLLAVLAVGTVRLLRKQWWVVGVFLIFVSVVPRFYSTQNLTTDYTAWCWRYLPLAGWALLTGAVLAGVLETPSRLLRRLAGIAAVVLVLWYGGGLVVTNLHARTAQDWWRFVLDKHPRRETAWVNLGRIHLARGNEVEARNHLFSSTLRAVRESSLVMARHYMDRNEMLAAAIHLQVAEREVRFGLNYQDLSPVSAAVLVRAGAPDFAEQHLGNVLSAAPCNTTAMKQIADILAAKGYVPAAVGYLQAALDIDPKDADAVSRLAALEKRLYYPESLPTPPKTTPPSPAWLKYIMGEPAQKTLKDDIITLADRRPEDPVIQLVASIVLSERKQHDRASQTVDGAVKMLPDYPFARTTQAYVAFNAGKVDQAVAVLDQMKDITPRDARSLLFFASARLEVGQLPIAIASTRAALRGNPNKPQSHSVLAALLVRHGRFREALDHYRHALNQPREKLGHVHNGLGYALMHLGEMEQALTHYRESIAIDPEQPRVYCNMATAFAGLGRFDESIRTLEEGLKAVGEDTGLGTDLAWLLSAVPQSDLRDGERAVRLAEAVFQKTDPLTPEVLDLLAAAYAENGQFPKAVETAEQAVRLARARKRLPLARDIEQRAAGYRDRRPFRLTPRP